MKAFVDGILDRISLKALGAVCVVVLVGVSMTGGLTFAHYVSGRGRCPFGGQEVAEAHFLPDGTVRMISRLSFTVWPDFTYLPLTAPAQPDSKIESVTVNGRPVPFSPTRNKHPFYRQYGDFYVLHGLPQNAMKDALVEVTWTFPFSDLKQDGTGFRLRGLIPIQSYAVNVIIDDGVPYQFVEKWKDETFLNIFSQGFGELHKEEFGTCGLGVRKM